VPGVLRRKRARRLARGRGSPGFGNARAVRNSLERAITRQSARVLAERAAGGQPDTLLLTREDLLGPKQLDVTSSVPLQQLQGMRGLARVKESVETLLQLLAIVAAQDPAVIRCFKRLHSSPIQSCEPTICQGNGRRRSAAVRHAGGGSGGAGRVGELTSPPGCTVITLRHGHDAR
jgi:hypothetical protein